MVTVETPSLTTSTVTPVTPGTSLTSSLTLIAQWLQVRPVALTVVVLMMISFR